MCAEMDDFIKTSTSSTLNNEEGLTPSNHTRLDGSSCANDTKKRKADMVILPSRSNSSEGNDVYRIEMTEGLRKRTVANIPGRSLLEIESSDAIENQHDENLKETASFYEKQIELSMGDKMPEVSSFEKDCIIHQSRSKSFDEEGVCHQECIDFRTNCNKKPAEEKVGDKGFDTVLSEKDSFTKCRVDDERITVHIEERICRICYDDGSVEDLCSPCKCLGSIGFVHQSCMFQWIGGRPKLKCEICQHKYVIERATKPFLEWSYPWVTHHDLYFIFMVIFSQEWIHVMESFILLISMYIINFITESSGSSLQFWLIIGLEIAYYFTHFVCGLILLCVRKWSALNQKFSLMNYDGDRVSENRWFSEEGSKLLYCLDLLVSFLLANPILKRMADKMVARAT